MNFLVQGSEAEALKVKMVELDKAGFGDFLTLQIHDEVVLDIPREIGYDGTAQEVEKNLYEDQIFGLPVTAEATTTWCWGLKETEYAPQPGVRPNDA
jgi:DNA polymerase I-like protein with 3'-5' exonuclease and polymerase domains